MQTTTAAFYAKVQTADGMVRRSEHTTQREAVETAKAARKAAGVVDVMACRETGRVVAAWFLDDGRWVKAS